MASAPFPTLLSLLVLAAGCGGGDDRPAAPADRVELHVVETLEEDADLYVEGSRSFVAVATPDGETVAETELDDAGEGKEATLLLAPGEYRLSSWQRPCDGNCGVLDPPTDRCETTLAVEPATPLTARISLRPGEGCTIEIAPPGPR